MGDQHGAIKRVLGSVVFEIVQKFRRSQVEVVVVQFFRVMEKRHGPNVGSHGRRSDVFRGHLDEQSTTKQDDRSHSTGTGRPDLES